MYWHKFLLTKWVYVIHNVYWSVSCTWPTISGMPKARSISCRAMTSAVLSRESSWSRSARSSLWPSLLARGPSNSSRGFPNWSLPQQTTQEMLSHFKKRRLLSQTPLMQFLNSAWGLLSWKNLEGYRWDQCEDLPACVPLWSINSESRVWPGRGLRCGPMSPKTAHTHIGFICTCGGGKWAVYDQYRVETYIHQSICRKWFLFKYLHYDIILHTN